MYDLVKKTLLAWWRLSILAALCLFGISLPKQASASPPIGININNVSDWNGELLFADAMKESRNWSTANLDSNGWPQQDASVYVWAGSTPWAVMDMSGAYALSFNGQATVAIASGVGTITNQVYTSGTNTTTATVTMSNGDLNLSFTATKRTSSSGTNTGITNVKLMRPTSPGASSSYSTSTLFSNQVKNLIAKFSVVRFMDYLATNGNQQANWSDRLNAYYSTYNVTAPAPYGWEGYGGAWEYAVQLCNQTNTDMWICIPVNATDAYVTNVANLIAYGGDGVNPYTSAQGSPVFAPLNANLKVYVEYSNELWNGVGNATPTLPFSQSVMNKNSAIAEVNAGGSPLNYDGDTSNLDWAARRSAKRTIEFSNIFRGVFGSPAMMTRIRPVLESQLGWGQFWLLQQTHMMQDYYNNPAKVASPHPPSYYIYGGGGSAYYDPGNTGYDINSIWTSNTFNTPTYVTNIQEDITYTLPNYGQRVAYEGGPGFAGNNPAVEQQAWSDPRMTTLVTQHQSAWNQNGGGLLVYFHSVDNYSFGFTSDINNLNTPKLNAVNQIDGAAATQGSWGAAIPGTIAAGTNNAPPTWVGTGFTVPSQMNAANAWNWFDYIVTNSAASAFDIAVSAGSTNANGRLDVYMDGAFVGTIAIPNTGSTSTYQTSAAVTTVTLAAGTHGIMIKASADAFAVNSLIITSGAPAIPPAPTALTAMAGNAQVSLTWNASPGATSYNIYRGTSAGGESGTAIATGIAAANYLSTGLTNGVTYFYKVVAVNSVGTSGNSNEASATPNNNPPATPTGLAATAGDTQVSLAWNAAGGATSYNVYRGTAAGGEAGTAIATGVAATNFTNTGLTDGTTYYFKVAAVNANGTSGQSNEASAKPQMNPPGAPGTLMASAGNALVSLTWGAAVGAASYNVYRGTTAGGENGTAIATGIAAANYTNTGLTNGVTYYFKVAGVNTAGTGPLSNEASATPSSVNYILNPGYESASQYWVGGGGIGVTSTNPHSGSSCGYESGGWSSYFQNVTGLQASTAYTVTVWARLSATTASSITVYVSNFGGTTVTQPVTSTSWTQLTLNFTTGSGSTGAQVGIIDNNGSAITGYVDDWSMTGGTSSSPPSPPAGLTATSGNAQVVLAWTASTGATSYNVYRGTAAGGENGTAIATGISTTAYTNTGLTNGTAYYYTVAAVSANGTSGMSNEASATPSAGTVATPTFSPAPGTYTSAQSVTLSDATSGAAIHYTTDGSTPTAASPTYSTAINVNASISIKAIGTLAGWNNSAVATGAYTINLPPAAPTGLTATAASTQATLTWTASSGATSYNVLRSTVSGSGYASVATGITVTNYTNTGLTNGITYYFVVTATNSSGTSGNSNQASATPTTASLPIRINAAGPAISPFVADIDFSGGTTATNWTGAIDTSATVNPAPQAVYQSERYGASTYTIPGLTSGTNYTVRLHFCENYFTTSAQRVFNVTINSTQVLTNFDIYAATGAPHKANIQQFGTTGNSSGQIVIALTNVTNNALINGIEILAAAAPPAPTGLTATAGNSQVALSWTASSGATSYNVLRSTVNGSGYASVATGITVTSYTNTGLTNGTTYYFVATAANAQGTSPNSAQASATPNVSVPPAPTGLTATPGSTQVSLSWTASSGATSYNVYRGTSAGGESGTAIITGLTTVSYTNTGLSNGTTYYFTVKSVNAAGTSGASNEASATPQAASGKYEAENGTLLGGAGVYTDHSGYSGTGFVGLPYQSLGAGDKFTVSVALSGTHSLDIRFSNGNGSARTASLYVNGSKVKQISFAGTPDWNTWIDDVESITLNSGGNTITLQEDSGDNGSFNTDYITVN